MAEGRRGLGRGLSALMDEAAAATTPEARRAAGVSDMPIELFRRNPDQPRKQFDPEELNELAASIRERGVLQPILARPSPEHAGEYQIIAGERRWRASQLAGLRVIPALIREMGDLEVMEVALIENIQRTDLNPMEEARGFGVLAKRFGRSGDSIASSVGKSRSHVANTIRLLKLPVAVQDHLEAGRITAGHARALLDLPEAEDLARQIIDGGLNVRQAEAMAKKLREPASSSRPGREAGRKSADTRDLESDLSETLGLSVQVHDVNGAGEVRIAYKTLEQLDDLCARLIRLPR
jgi:ParB family chromosome partitioning protein